MLGDNDAMATIAVKNLKERPMNGSTPPDFA